MANLYAEDGVNVQEEAAFSAFAFRMSRRTYKNSPFVEIQDLSKGYFRGLRQRKLIGLRPGWFTHEETDGLGTKPDIHVAAGTYLNVGSDLLGATNGDITRFGGVPVRLVSNVLNVATIGTHGDPTNSAFRKLMNGLKRVAKEQRIVVYTGEVEQLGDNIGSAITGSPIRFDWSGTAEGIYDPTRLITGNSLRPGQFLIALREPGFRCNGFKSVYVAFRRKFGEEWWNNPEAKRAIRLAATPSALYDLFLATANGWFEKDFQPLVKVELVVHVTGGGLREKLGRDILFPRGLSADLINLWDPPKIMRDCAEWRGMDDAAFYSTWNGGQGVIAAVDPFSADDFISLATKFEIEARICGSIVETKNPVLRISSKLNKGVVEFHPE
ncbi:hypothetical protein IID24_02055 [Patescibacteria group bacterium]|nr:hypothetical protein [Patescibacteria group bacterium]